MNGTWLAFFTLLMVVLIAVAVGAQQMEAQQAQQISALMSQRDTTVNVALEAKEQRDAALKVRDEAVTKLDGLNAQIAALQGDLQKTALDLQTAHSEAETRQMEIDRLAKEASDLRAQMTGLQVRYGALEAQYVKLQQDTPQIPVVGGKNTKTEIAERNSKAICLPVQADKLPNQLGLGLAVLVGMAALGSGGYIYYRHDPSRKYAVRMTKEQIREYARYQRERGNRAV